MTVETSALQQRGERNLRSRRIQFLRDVAQCMHDAIVRRTLPHAGIAVLIADDRDHAQHDEQQAREQLVGSQRWASG